jgi:hypothetical protein
LSQRVRMCALDEVLLVRAGCVNGGSLNSGLALAATAKGQVGTAKQSAENANGKLYQVTSANWSQ